MSQVRHLKEKLKRKKEKYAELKAAAYSVNAIRYKKDRIKSTRFDCKFENLVIRYMTLEPQIQKEEQELNDLMQRISSQIDNMSNEKYKEVLKLIYFENMSYTKIARKYDVSRKTVHRWQDKALEQFEDTNDDFVS